MNLKEIFCTEGDKKGQDRFKDFNLKRFFTLFTIGIMLLISLVLGFVFIGLQKRMLIDHAISTTEDFARYLKKRLYKINLVSSINRRDDNSPDTSDTLKKLDSIIRREMSEFPDVLKVKIYDRKGRIFYSTNSENIRTPGAHPRVIQALRGTVTSNLTYRRNPLAGEKTEKGKVYAVDILEIYVPMYKSFNGSVSRDEILGVFGVHRNISFAVSSAKSAGYTILVIFISTMSLLFLLLQLIIRKADSIIRLKNEEIDRQNAELEAAQRTITESIDEVIEHESFHVRYVNESLLKCWEVKKCRKNDCPSYQSDNHRCWQVAGTFCGGEVQGIFARKYGDCRKCEVFRHAFNNRMNTIGESFNNMMALLQNKQLELQEANEKLNVLIDIDPLTEVGNRRSFQKRIESIHLLSLRHNHPYGIILCDIDDFKLFNDTYGHQQGDYALVSISNAMRASIRRTDEIFRWGGEEFIIILPEQGHADALKVAEHIRSRIYCLEIKHAKSDLNVVTVSCGVASFYPWKTRDVGWEFVIKQADDALYKAKKGKKNCIYSSASNAD